MPVRCAGGRLSCSRWRRSSITSRSLASRKALVMLRSSLSSSLKSFSSKQSAKSSKTTRAFATKRASDAQLLGLYRVALHRSRRAYGQGDGREHALQRYRRLVVEEFGCPSYLARLGFCE